MSLATQLSEQYIFHIYNADKVGREHSAYYYCGCQSMVYYIISNVKRDLGTRERSEAEVPVDAETLSNIANGISWASFLGSERRLSGLPFCLGWSLW